MKDVVAWTQGLLVNCCCQYHLSVVGYQARLTEINTVLAEEYAVRRQMLLKRADVTIQSFKWSERAKVSQFSLVSNLELAVAPSVGIEDLPDVHSTTRLRDVSPFRACWTRLKQWRSRYGRP